MWTFNDAWILQAAVGAESIRDLIAHADYINVSPPSLDEVNRAVPRLEAAGLVVTHGLSVTATDAGKRLAHSELSVREATPGIEARLSRLPVPATPSAWRIAPAEWRAAYEEYMGA
jgi:hypothetical protein